MLPELQVLLERAAARRAMLDGLLDVIPVEDWERRADGDAWSIENHVQHLASVEALTIETIDAVRAGAAEVWAGGSERLTELLEARALAMAEVADLEAGDLRARMAESRAAMNAAVGSLQPPHLDATVRISGVVDSWGRPVGMSLRAYLRAWPEHDLEHDGAIRRALQARPDLSTAALVRRAQRRLG